MNLEQYVMGATVLIGFVNGIKLALDGNWKSFGLFSTAIVAGSVFGYFHWFTIPSLEIGFALGIASSGVYEVSQRVGGK